MGGLSRQDQASTDDRIGSLRIQKSLYGVVVPLPYGRNKLPVNLMWYGDFTAIPQEERSETGKGGGQPPSRTFYLYTASVVMLLGEATIGGVRRIWKGKERFDGSPVTEITRLVATENHYIGADLTVSVSNPAVFYQNSEVIDEYDYGPDYQTNVGMVEGVDFTVSNGVYTFEAQYKFHPISIKHFVRYTNAQQSALGELGLTLVPNGGDVIWQHLLDDHPTEAVPYAGWSYLFAQDYPLSDYAQTENHNIEYEGAFQVSASNPDCHPVDVIYDLMTNLKYGASLPASMVGSTATVKAMTDGLGIYFSPFYVDQQPARNRIKELLEASFCDVAWDGARLNFVPLWDQAAGSYTPVMTPVFDLTPDDFLEQDDDDPIEITQVDPAELDNLVTIEWANREQDYQIEPVVHRDESMELEFGRRSSPARVWHFICKADIARRIAGYIHTSNVAQKDTFEFSLPFSYVEVLPGTFVTLTNPGQYLDRTLVMITSVKDVDHELRCKAKLWPAGHANAATIPSQLGTGHIPNWNAPAGSVDAPMFIEPPGGFTKTGLELWIAVSGSTPAWGGCDIYASMDGGNSYKQVATVNQSARYGTLLTDLTNADTAIARVDLKGQGGKLFTVSDEEAAALRTLVYVGTPESGEYLAYQTAALIQGDQYDLAGLVRAQHGTKQVAHSAGEPWSFVDLSLPTSGPLSLSTIGKTLKFKFVSFNVHGGGLESLADATEYEYTVTGRFVEQRGRPFVANMLRNATFNSGLNHWTSDAAGKPNHSVVIGGDNAIQGYPTSIAIIQDAALTTGSSLLSDPISVRGGERWFVGCEVYTEHCFANMSVIFYKSDGERVGPQRFVADRLVQPAGNWGGGSLATDYQKVGRFIDVPSDAQTAVVQLNKSGAWYQQTPTTSKSVTRFLRPMFGEAVPGETLHPKFSVGPQGGVSSEQIDPGATGRLIVVPDSDIQNVNIWTNDKNSIQLLAQIEITAPAAQTVMLNAGGTVKHQHYGGQSSAHVFITDLVYTQWPGDTVDKVVARNPDSSIREASGVINKRRAFSMTAGQTKTFRLYGFAGGENAPGSDSQVRGITFDAEERR